ncbi:psbQ-like protein 3, chloroplastic [Solanum dulcamara]|uniref:psbQ-like protein 3, chloroplastic n=1 Tax=Solanum dulcamara TaxID=45834 RepID=UPI002485BD39|nr:psbQ-like protein 3, chloroplastic [Solanum dulcamara]
MALIHSFQKPNKPLTPFTCSNIPNNPTLNKPKKMSLNSHNITRRTTVIILCPTISFILQSEQQNANAFDFRITTPDQTLEEAENGIQTHAHNLLQVKELLEAESWKEAQKALRKSSALLKQDIYTIIQAKPGKQRPELRKMYSILFNNVTRMDFAARDKDVPRVWGSYHNIVTALNNLLSRL